MAELLEATRKVPKYFKRSYKHSKPHLSENSNCHINTNHYSTSLSDRHKQQSSSNNDKVNEVSNSTHTSNSAPSEPANSEEHHDSDNLDSRLNSSSDLE